MKLHLMVVINLQFGRINWHECEKMEKIHFVQIGTSLTLQVRAKNLLSEDMEEGPEVSVAGRIVAFRLMGKASFLKVLDRDGRMQAYVRRDEIGDEEYASFKKLILVILLELKESFFVQRQVRSPVRAKEYRLVSKALRPLPEKWHGLTDNEQIYRRDIWI